MKTEFHICCSNFPKTILDFAKLCILPDFLPQPSNFLHGYIHHEAFPFALAVLLLALAHLELKLTLLLAWVLALALSQVLELALAEAVANALVLAELCAHLAAGT